MKRGKKGEPFYRWIIIAYLLPVLGKFVLERMKIPDRQLKEFCMKLSMYNPILIIYAASVVLVISISAVSPSFFESITSWEDTLFGLLVTIVIGLPLTSHVLTHVLKTNKYRNLYPTLIFGIFGAAYAHNAERNQSVKSRIWWVFLINFLSRITTFLLGIIFAICIALFYALTGAV
jgi:hypothetical protein